MYLQVIINCEMRFVDAGLESESDGSALAKTQGQHDHANIGVGSSSPRRYAVPTAGPNSRDRGRLLAVVHAAWRRLRFSAVEFERMVGLAQPAVYHAGSSSAET
jgi:hypothetical protein